jgi:hypothetical protein
MLWVTRSQIRVNRAATGWLIRRFIDPDATFRFTEPQDVARIQQAGPAIGFDAPGAHYPHRDGAGRCSFEALVEEYQPWDGALRALARIVHRADFPEEAGTKPGREPSFDTITLIAGRDVVDGTVEAVGLRAIARGFPLVAADDYDTLDRCAFLYDALYASLQERTG